jgi:hypothetical protein
MKTERPKLQGHVGPAQTSLPPQFVRPIAHGFDARLKLRFEFTPDFASQSMSQLSQCTTHFLIEQPWQLCWYVLFGGSTHSCLHFPASHQEPDPQSLSPLH